MLFEEPCVHVYALLGKALREGQISREYQGRLDRFAALLCSVSPVEQNRVALCGGRGEATAARDDLLNRTPSPLADLPCFLDEESLTTQENFAALGRYLRRLALQVGALRLTIVSSRQHLERLQFIDEHLGPQSLLEEVTPALPVSRITWAAARLPADGDVQPALRWWSDVYQESERLLPLQVNLEGVLASRLNRLVEPAFARYQSSLRRLHSCIAIPPAGLVEQFPTAYDEASQFVGYLDHLGSQIAPWVEWIGGSAQRLQGLLHELRGSLRALRSLADPDSPHLDPLFREK